MALKFQGGIKLSEFRNTKKLPITVFDRPSVATLVMENGLFPCVCCGENVSRYQRVAVNEEGFAVSATIPGKVIEADEKYVIIENSFVSDNAPADAERPSSIENIDIDSLIDYCKRYGVTGAFSGIPFYKKLKEAHGKCERIVINCVESDPASGHVRAMVRENARELVLGIKILMKAMGVLKTVIAIDKKSSDDIEALRKYIDIKSGIVFALINVKYPAGCERLLLNAIYNNELSCDTEVWRAGYPVFSAETVINLYQSLRDGLPVIYKTLTASGTAMIKPMNYRVPIGTHISELFDESELTTKTKCVYGAGGLLGGHVAEDGESIGRNTNTIFAMKDRRFYTGNCLKCAKCTFICPMHLVPFKFHENFISGKHEESVSLGLYNCIECGCCAYMCVGKVDLLGEIRKEKYGSLTVKQAYSETMVFEPVNSDVQSKRVMDDIDSILSAETEKNNQNQDKPSEKNEINTLPEDNGNTSETEENGEETHTSENNGKVKKDETEDKV